MSSAVSAAPTPLSLSSSFAMPKSSSFTMPSFVTRMFEGLMSRWTIRFACALPTASSTCRKRRSARVARERVLGDVVVDANTVDVLEHQIGLSASAHPRVQESRNSRMRETREHRALASKARLTGGRHEREIEQLHGGAPFERPVRAASQPHGAHPAAAQRALERVRAKLDAAQRDCGRRLQKCTRLGRSITVHE